MGSESRNVKIEVRSPQTIRKGELLGQVQTLGDPGDYKPNFTILPDGRVFLTMFRQKFFGERPMETIMIYEADSKLRHWRGPMYPPPPGREPYLSPTPQGTLLITTHLLDSDVHNPYGVARSYVHRWAPGGVTWSTTSTDHLAPPGEDVPDKLVGTSRNILSLDQNLLVMFLSTAGLRNFIWRSTDDGRSWAESPCNVEGVPSDYPYRLFEEAHLWISPNGRIFALCRVDARYFPLPGMPVVETEGNDQFDRLIVYVSHDGGENWSVYKNAFGAYGMMYPSILALDKNRLLLTYTNRKLDPPLGVRAVLGWQTDDGFEFVFDHDVIILDANTPESLSSGGGFGPTIRLNDGALATCYSYRDAKDVTHAEILQWRLPVDVINQAKLDTALTARQH